MGTSNKNNFCGETNFNGPTQIIAGSVVNNKENSYEKRANYKPEPIWRSPFTMAILTWISVVIGLFEIYPFGNILKAIIDLFKMQNISYIQEIPIYSIMFAAIFVVLMIAISLRRITQKQIRYPLLFNFAISGYGERLTIEKIHIDRCPQCGGKMKYYNKPVEWREIYNNGKVKREIVKKIPALECKRNSKHFYEVDPAEEQLDN